MIHKRFNPKPYKKTPAFCVRHFLYGGVAYFVCAASSAWAVLPDAGRLLQEQIPTPSAPLPSSPANLGRPPAPTTAAPKATEETVIYIGTFRFSGGLDKLSPEELQTWIKPHTDKGMTFSALKKIVDNLSQFLRSKGYGFARAYLPAQEIKDGVVDITILLGRIEGGKKGDGIAIQGGEGLRLKEERVRQTLAAATVSQTPYLKVEGLERGLLLLNDLPGVSAQASLDPGSTQGDTKLRVDMGEGRLLSGLLWLDNAGNRYTGEARLNGQLNVNDPTGQGDQFYAQASVAERFGLGKLGYSLPLGYDGMRLGASYTGLGYEVGKAFAALNNRGTAQTFNLNATYPIVRQREHNLSANVSYDLKAMRDQSLGVTTSDKRVDTWNAGISGNEMDRLGGGGMTQYGVSLAVGEVDLSRAGAALTADHAGPNTQGNYTKLNYSLSRLQRIDSNWAVFGALNGQFADRNLDSSEKFLLGGASGVRAYPSGEASGDEGMLLNLEVRYDLPLQSRWGNWQFVGFYDKGQVARYKTVWEGQNAFTPGQSNRYGLSGAGVGINLSKGDSHAVRFAYAWKIGDNPGASMTGRDSDGTQDTGRFWLQTLFYLQ